MSLGALHLPSFLIASLICYALVGVQLLLALRHMRSSAGLGWWVLGFWLVVGAHAVLIVRSSLPDALALVLSNGTLMAGMVAMVEGLSHFVQGRGFAAPARPLLVAAVVGTAAVTFLPVGLRVFLVSLLGLVPVLLALQLLWQARRRTERALKFIGFAMVLIASMLVARGAEALLVPEAYAAIDRAGPLRALSFLSLIVLLVGGSFAFLLAIVQRSNARLEQLAQIDPLTGCLNRRAAQQVAVHALQRARREGKGLALLVLDIDHFKRINDGHGHPAGDRVLRSFVAALRGRLRESDLLARMGGEEFSALLPDTDRAGAMAVAESLRQVTEQMQLQDEQGRAMPVSVSVGVALLAPGEPTDLQQLYQRADTALYAAKAAGRNCVRLDESQSP